MGHKFADLMFTPAVQKIQSENGSREGFSRWDTGPDFHHQIDNAVASFIAERDSFYMASVTETGWPYLQHRGGPKGFLKIIDDTTLGFADYSGNRQYISTGNFKNNDRIALFFMDYANRRRLKMLGRVQLVTLDDIETLSTLESDQYRANVERGFIIHLEAYDWNCPQHITPRFDEDQIDQIVAPLIAENTQLKEQIEEQFQEQLQGQCREQQDPETNPQLEPEAPLVHSEATNPTVFRTKEPSIELTISGIRQLTPTIRSYELAPIDNRQLPKCEPGAHLQIPIALSDGITISRHYSIHNDPSTNNRYEIAVLKTSDDDNSGSATIHRTFTLGQTLNVELPSNYFALDPNLKTGQQAYPPITLLAAGIGITPLKAMALALKKSNIAFNLHYAGKNTRHMAFADELKQVFKEQLFLYESEQQDRLTIGKLLTSLAPNTQIYSCGPSRFLDEIKQQSEELNLNPNNLFFEQFNNVTDAQNTPFSVELKRSGIVIDVKAEESMLDALENAGIALPNSCRTGNCRTCAIPLISGEVTHNDNVLNSEEQKTLLCPCVSRATDEMISVDL